MRNIVLQTLAIVAAVSMLSCSRAKLYRGNAEAAGPDRLTLDGRVCTDEPGQAHFPTRVALIVDQAQPALSTWDALGTRAWVRAVEELVDVGQASRELSFAIIGMHGQPELLTGETFTRDPIVLDNALARLPQLQPCGAGGCRDIRGAIGVVKSLIEGDSATLTKGELARTQYLIILISAGMPLPVVPGCLCADPLVTQNCCFDFDCYNSMIVEPVLLPCQLDTLVQDVEELKTAVEEAGAASMRFHTFHLLAPDVIDDTTAVGYAIDEVAVTHELLTQMAFAGKGTFKEFASPEAVNFLGLELLASAGALDIKGLVVSNVNALPLENGLEPDSDGDGLADIEEATWDEGVTPVPGTCPQPGVTDLAQSDSDCANPGDPTQCDGITDLVDRLLGFDPCTPEPPETRPTCAGVGIFDDTDFDGLRDCEELLIGTDPTLVDTDGDVLPDKMEVTAGTRFLEPDALLDDDGDGVPNGEEVRNHTDPSSSDAGRHLGEAYRYELANEGLQRLLQAQQPLDLTGVEVDQVSAGTTGGLGSIRYVIDPISGSQTLQWRDAVDPEFGPPVDVSDGGQFELRSSSAVDPALAEDRTITVTVDDSILPISDTDEAILVRLTERRCLRYSVRNVRLVGTQAANFGDAGDNNVFVYFAESPQGRLEAPGLFRIVSIPVNFQPPSTRTPDDPILFITDDEFVQAGF